MSNKLRLLRLLKITLTAGAAFSVLATAATAQEASETLVAESRDGRRPPRDYTDYRTIPEQFNRAFYSHDGNFFDNRGIWQSFRLIFGIPNYVENSISQDGRAVDRLYKEVLEQQVSSDPVLRTPDLPNPYTGSVLTTPIVITEEPITPIPPFPTIRRPPTAPPPPGVEDSTRREPVPALW